MATLLVALTSGGLLVACGGDDDDTGETVTTSLPEETTTTTTSEETTTTTMPEASTGKPASYPKIVRSNFMRYCITSGGRRCGCKFEALERTLSLKEFREIEADIQAGGRTPAVVAEAFSTCE